MKGIIGAIVGNSIGRTFSIKPTKNYDFKISYDKTNPGDDSIAIIATADWLMNTNHTKDEYIDKLHYWCDKYNYGMWHYDISTKFKDWIRNKRREPYNSYGNGSAMRVCPIGWYAKSIEEAENLAKITAEVTHNHPEGIKGAQAIAVAIFMIRSGYDKNIIKDKISRRYGYNLNVSYNQLKKQHKNECICQRSVPASLICWLNSSSYEDCIRKAISLGGDCDTEGSIAGALAAVKYDVDDNLVFDLTRFFPMDYMEVFNKFHAQCEIL